MQKTRSIIHVTVGDNNWDPTPEEIEAIRSEFADAVSEAGIDEECSVAVPRKGVEPVITTITASDCDEAEVAKYGNWPFTVNVCVISLSLAAVLIAIILK